MPRWLDDGVADAILTAIDEADGPVGARQVRIGLAGRGHHLSESSIARRLRDLDAQGLTQPVGSKGRTVTARGAEIVRRSRRTASGADLAAATEIKTAEDLLNLLRARRAIEPEALRDATRNTTPAHVEQLRGIVEAHRQQLAASEAVPRDVALRFHREATTPTQNPLVQAMLRIVLDNTLDRVEEALDVILEAHHHADISVSEHEAIVDAIADGDEERASELMRAHLDRLLNEVEKFLVMHDSGLVERMLRRR
ncbi:FCD domain-containing protein [Saccharopolyspora shandongensis]|uniref:FCD domain-containing protein n=1 Tax=Saccharopolyspora shandongensis TaxID=418495 RepID=UPI0034357A1F